MKLNNEIRLQSYGKHDAESHSVDISRQGLDLEQRATVERIARANPTSSATQVQAYQQATTPPQKENRVAGNPAR